MICLDCLQDKAETEFYCHARTGPQDICKACTVESNRIRRTDPAGYLARIQTRRLRRKTAGVPDHKVCTKCTQDLKLEAFREKTRGLYGRSSWCRACEKADDEARRCGSGREAHLDRRRQAWANKPRSEEQKAAASKRTREWYALNKDRQAETVRRWVEANREAVNAIQARRRAKKREVVTDLTLDQWQETLEQFNHACAYCLRSDVPMTMDHMDPISNGGQHTQSNVIPACKSCNCAKGARSTFSMLSSQG